MDIEPRLLAGLFFCLIFALMKHLFQYLILAGLLVACGSPSETESSAPVIDEAPAVQKDPRAVELDSLNAALVKDPNNLEVLEARAAVYVRMQNLKYAAADVSAVLQLDSNRTKALELWGDISFATNQSRQSRDAWTKCMMLDPTYAPCRLKMAELYHVVTEFEKSAQLVDEVLSLEPKNSEAHFLKGLLMRDALGDTTRALEWFQKAIDLNPEYIEALDMCGVLYSAMGNPLALAYYNRLLELDPENRNTYYNRGMFALAKQDWNGALADFTKCTQLDPRDIESFFNLGYIHLQLQMPGVARDYFTQALRVQPINHRALYGRGYAFEQLGDMDNAEADYLQALGYNPDHAGSKAGLSRVQQAKQQH